MKLFYIDTCNDCENEWLPSVSLIIAWIISRLMSATPGCCRLKQSFIIYRLRLYNQNVLGEIYLFSKQFRTSINEFDKNLISDGKPDVRHSRRCGCTAATTCPTSPSPSCSASTSASWWTGGGGSTSSSPGQTPSPSWSQVSQMLNLGSLA